MFAGGQQVVEVAHGRGGLAERGRVDHLPDRLDPSRFHQPRDVLAADLAGISHVDGQLLDLGRQDPDLGADQLDQEPGRIEVEMRTVLRTWRGA